MGKVKAGWRKRHGLEGGETGPDDDLIEEASTDIGAVVMGVRHLKYRVVK